VGMNGIVRTKSNDLTDWTKKLIAFLPNINDATESMEQRNQLIDHFKIIKVGITIIKILTFHNKILYKHIVI